MAWARPPGAPQMPSCPMELLEPKETDYKSLFNMYGLQACGMFLGFLGPGFSNIYRNRPFYTGIWKHIVCGVSLGLLSFKVKDLMEEVWADKDEVLRQYVNLHPEDFPAYRRKLIKDTIEPWDPRR